MTKVFFVRHAQPEHNHADDRTRPLTAEGIADSQIVLETLRDKKIDAFYCSPYKRSMDTIQGAADYYGMTIQTDERLRERKKVRTETITACFKSAGPTMITMRRAVSPLTWYSGVTLRR